jgi:hypothetical protein
MSAVQSSKTIRNSEFVTSSIFFMSSGTFRGAGRYCIITHMKKYGLFFLYLLLVVVFTHSFAILTFFLQTYATAFGYRPALAVGTNFVDIFFSVISLSLAFLTVFLSAKIIIKTMSVSREQAHFVWGAMIVCALAYFVFFGIFPSFTPDPIYPSTVLSLLSTIITALIFVFGTIFFFRPNNSGIRAC